MRDPYAVLGVAPTASQDEIKKAYRQMARLHHPDANPGNAASETKFKEVSAAYDLLSDAAKRGRFDRGEIDAEGNETAQGFGGGGFGGGFGGFKPGGRGRRASWSSSANRFTFDDIFGEDDPFADVFGRAGGRAGTAGMGAKGKDSHFVLKIDFAEAVNGTTKRVTLTNGRRIDVKVPPGTEDGKQLRLKGQGQASPGGGEPGDAFVEIKIKPHDFFIREGRDVIIEVPISLKEAVLGGKITVPTVDGKVAVTVPPGTSSGKTLRLRGKGAPDGAGETRGDQLVKLRIVLPDPMDPELEKLVKKWTPVKDEDLREQAGMGD